MNHASRVLFIHRSCGANLLRQGHVRELITRSKAGIALDDYNQNKDTLTDANGNRSFFKIDFTENDTTPEAYAAFFNDANQDNTMLQRILSEYDVIVIKSCYPNNAIRSDEVLDELKVHYKSVAAFFAKHPDKQLGIMTTPPLISSKTSADEARRAQALASWLASTKLGTNVRVFDFYDLLVDKDSGTLRSSRQRLWARLGIPDSHPNRKANRAIAPKFVSWLTGIAEKAKAWNTMRDHIKEKLNQILRRYERLGLTGSPIYAELQGFVASDVWLNQATDTCTHVRGAEKIFNVVGQITTQDNDHRVLTMFAEYDTALRLTSWGKQFFGNFTDSEYLERRNHRQPDFKAWVGDAIVPVETKMLGEGAGTMTGDTFVRKFVKKVGDDALSQLARFYEDTPFEQGIIFVWTRLNVEWENPVDSYQIMNQRLQAGVDMSDKRFSVQVIVMFSNPLGLSDFYLRAGSST